MRRLSLFSAVAALSMLAAPLAAPAWAGQYNSAPTYQSAMSNALAKRGSASALSLNNNAIDQSNLKFGRGGLRFQSNSAPTHQSATSNAFALHGDASATSVNTNEIVQGNGAFGRKSPFQSNRAPTTQSAVSTAVSIGGNATALSANSNGVSQGNIR
jgi:hypothetical protein